MKHLRILAGLLLALAMALPAGAAGVAEISESGGLSAADQAKLDLIEVVSGDLRLLADLRLSDDGKLLTYSGTEGLDFDDTGETIYFYADGARQANDFFSLVTSGSAAMRFRYIQAYLSFAGGSGGPAPAPFAYSIALTGSDTFPSGAEGRVHQSGGSGSGTCAANSLFYHDGTSWTLVDDGSTCSP